MLAAKHNDKVFPTSIRLGQHEVELLEEIEGQYPRPSRNELMVAAVRYWAEAAKKSGLDANLMPLRRSA